MRCEWQRTKALSLEGAGRRLERGKLDAGREGPDGAVARGLVEDLGLVLRAAGIPQRAVPAATASDGLYVETPGVCRWLVRWLCGSGNGISG